MSSGAGETNVGFESVAASGLTFSAADSLSWSSLLSRACVSACSAARCRCWALEGFEIGSSPPAEHGPWARG